MGFYVSVPDPPSNPRPSIIPQVILVPAVITLAVTALRLVAELRRWPAGPPGLGVVINMILWAIFGIYFGLKLARAGEAPASVGKAIWRIVQGVTVLFVFSFLGFHLMLRFQEKVIVGVLLDIAATMAGACLAATLVHPAWPSLFKASVAFGYAARVPVTIIMFVAFRGNWGTAYDAVPSFFPAMGFWLKFTLLGVVFELIIWVGVIALAAMLFGTIAAAIAHKREPAQKESD